MESRRKRQLFKFQFIEQLQALGNNTLSLWESWQKSLIFD